MTHVVSANGIDFLYFVAECHCLVNDQLEEIMRGRFPRQHFKLAIDSATPSYGDPKGNLCPNKSRYLWDNWQCEIRYLQLLLQSGPNLGWAGQQT